MKHNFKFSKQHDSMDCGSSCIRMIASFYGKEYSLDTLRSYTYSGKDGVSLLSISKTAEKIGFKTIGGLFTLEGLIERASFPCILHWDQNHFVVLYKITILR